ncbi:hypothetical protein [Shewanella violacea]|uniref:Uncharacterized protein n=1 Tax=Shewanella violacea (strain JCM 10179 / CIP 106290 / LMG 19151 / DSS12) TaxID=637905 RepID=D4ZC79_SHEVD|nr:hypothetical protein [Shewanella violacea]BAJ03624.1 hypothetical protein SVI_3653 [Shewanella violacea DSS12]
MHFEISKEEKTLLLSLNSGISKVKIYKGGSYPSVVSFILKNGKTVTICIKEEYVAHWFEVFPISISEDNLSVSPEIVLDGADFSPEVGLNILSKAEWTVPANAEEKTKMIGETEGAMVQSEGLASEIPSNANNQATLHAGIEINKKSGIPFIVASSISPYTLYVSDCNFYEPFDERIYDRVQVC